MNPQIDQRSMDEMRRLPAAIERLEQRRLLSAAAVGPAYPVNTFTADTQNRPSIAMDAQGNHVIAWHSRNQDGDALGIYAQRFSAAGAPLGQEFRVNTHTAGNQSGPRVAADAGGNFVIVWQSNGQDGSGWGVYGQRFDAFGARQGEEFRVNSSTADAQQAPAVAMSPGGAFVVAWETIVADGQDPQPYGPWDVFAQRYDAAGVPQGQEFRVNSHVDRQQYHPAVSIDAAGNFVVTWEGATATSNLNQISARRFDSAGVPAGGDISVWVTEGYHPAVAVGAEGDFVITWTLPSTLSSSPWCNGQRFDPSGVPVGGAFRVNSVLTGLHERSSIAMGSDGSFVVAWHRVIHSVTHPSTASVHFRRFNANGSAAGPETPVSDTAEFSLPSISVDAAGDFIVAFSGGPIGSGSAGSDVYARRYTVNPAVASSSFDFASAPHALSFTFNHDASPTLSTSNLVVQNLTAGQPVPSGAFTLSYDLPTNTAEFGYQPGVLPDGNYRAILLAAGTALPADHVLEFFVLAGDANRDRAVDIGDFAILASHFNAAGTFADGDFNYSGQVEIGDFAILASRFNATLPAAAAAAVAERPSAAAAVPIPVSAPRPFATRRLSDPDFLDLDPNSTGTV